MIIFVSLLPDCPTKIKMSMQQSLLLKYWPDNPGALADMHFLQYYIYAHSSKKLIRTKETAKTVIVVITFFFLKNR
ncbi:MAG: hypothetical protein ACLTER_19195 [Ruminococcus sp.]